MFSRPGLEANLITLFLIDLDLQNERYLLVKSSRKSIKVQIVNIKTW